MLHTFWFPFLPSFTFYRPPQNGSFISPPSSNFDPEYIGTAYFVPPQPQQTKELFLDPNKGAVPLSPMISRILSHPEPVPIAATFWVPGLQNTLSKWPRASFQGLPELLPSSIFPRKTIMNMHIPRPKKPSRATVWRLNGRSLDTQTGPSPTFHRTHPGSKRLLGWNEKGSLTSD